MIIFGDKDPIIPYNGGEITIFGKRGKVVSVKNTLNFFLKNNNLKDEHQVHLYHNQNLDSTKAYKHVYKIAQHNEITQTPLV